MEQHTANNHHTDAHQPRSQPVARRHGWKLAALALIASISCATAPPHPVSDHCDGHTFHNPQTRIEDPSFWDLVVHITTGRSTPWPDDVPLDRALALDQALDNDQVAITFVNHATVLIQTPQMNILTDPVWSQRVGPWSWAGPERARQPGIPFDALPPIDAVLLSHNHYDHTDLPTIIDLWERDQPRFLVPLGDRQLLEDEGITTVTEMDWWDQAPLGHSVKITFTPAQHNSGRGLTDAKESLWGSFMIHADKRMIYFGGDTAYSPHFAAIQARLGSPDIALLPIGAYAPRATMRPFHMDPDDAVQAQLDLRAVLAIGIHFGTFQLTNEAIDDPIKDLQAALQARRLPTDAFITLSEGRTQRFDLLTIASRHSDAAAPSAPRP